MKYLERKKIRTKRRVFSIIFILILILFFLSLLEVGLRIFYPQTSSLLSKEDYIKANEKITLYNPHLERDYSYTVITNSDNMRNSKEFSLNHTNPRIVLLGDSMAFGQGVEQEEMFSSLLENNFKDLEVLNLAVPGTETAGYYSRLNQKGLKYNPDVVIVALFMGNDLRMIGNITSDNFTIKYIPPKPLSLFLTRNVQSLKFLWRFFYQSKITKPIANLLNVKTESNPVPLIIDDEEKLQQSLELLDNNLKYFKESSEKNNFKLLFLIIPAREQVDKTKLREYLENINPRYIEESRIRKDIINTLNKNKIDYLDVTPDMQKLNINNTFYYSIDGHLNKEGHKLIARLLTKKLENEI
ncbi:MAG: hypothetical protein PHG05_04865 [Candidatus Nanoarchaeia archaeon]|nr:hypothetical protein [Candidatus Nanoarchaeia archaeon]